MINRIPPRAAAVLMPLAAALAICAAQPSWAVDLSPYATVGVESNSNLFALPKNEPPPEANGYSGFGDTVSDYVAGLTGDFPWAQNSFTFTAQGTRFDYAHYTLIDHTEYQVGSQLDWHLGPVVETVLSYTQTHYMAPFADTLATQLELDTERTAEGRVRILVTPQWQIELAPRDHDFDSPLPEYPDFGLHETGGSADLDYLGVAKLTAGLEVDYVDGAYSGIVEATKYHQTTEELTAVYKVAGMSDFNAKLGYTQRNSVLNPDGSIASPAGGLAAAGAAGQIGTISTVTGSFGYDRQLTAKTGFTLAVFRAINSYVAGANSQVGTGGQAAIRWNPDVRFNFELDYRQEFDTIQGNVVIVNAEDRRDRYRSTKFVAKYLPFSWLTVRAYVGRDDRVSNLAEATYSVTEVGLDLTARRP